jgi:hypothetical protein
MSESQFGFSCQSVESVLGSLMPRRKAEPVRPWATMTVEDSFAMIDEVMERYLPDYKGMSTFEMFKRQMPYSTELTKFAALGALLDNMLPYVYRFVLSQARPGVGAYEKRSRLGYPFFNLPLDKAHTIAPYLELTAQGDLSVLDHAFATINVRLQPEKLAKKREYLFVDPSCKITEREITAKDRFDDRIERYASRTRLVFNYPVVNLCTQIADNAFHKALLRYPMFGRDMMGWAKSNWTTRKPAYVAFDLKHFERITGFVTNKWAQLVGGIYGDAISRMMALPFLTPAVGQGKEHWHPMLVGTSSTAFVVQLGSGLSPVAPIQKITMLAVYMGYLVERGMSPDDALTALIHQQGDFVVHNYGDDNFVEADSQSILDNLYSYLQKYLDVEIEDPPAFLGLAYNPITGFKLQADSYLLNWFLNERMPGSRFRPYPEHGWRARNEIYRMIGDPSISREILPWLEDHLLPKYGITPQSRERQYYYETLAMSDQHVQDSAFKLVVLEKLYQLTDEQKADMEWNYSILGEGFCSDIYRRIVPNTGL